MDLRFVFEFCGGIIFVFRMVIKFLTHCVNCNGGIVVKKIEEDSLFLFRGRKFIFIFYKDKF